MTFVEKLKADGLPIALFALIVGAKVYSLWTYLVGNPALFGMLKDIDSIDAYGPGAARYLTSSMSYLLYFVTATAFDALVLYSFIVRGAAKSRPEGPAENILPLVTVFVPVIGFTLLFLPQVRAHVPGYSPETLDALAAFTPRIGFYINLTGVAMGFVGAAFSIWAVSYLRRSFGLRAAVRSLVTTGPYSRIRHPLYVGEIVHIFGIAVLSATPVGLYLFSGALVLQILRAKVEERKFLRTLPEYADYMRRTGFLWPKLGRS
jgi:protein-S-isoprenylcysteine O-methyltransferase Ste14